MSNFEAGMNILIEDSIGGAMFVTNDAGTTNIVSGAEQRILIGQFTTDGVMSGVVNVQMFTEGIVDPADRLALPFDGVGLHTEGRRCGVRMHGRDGVQLRRHGHQRRRQL